MFRLRVFTFRSLRVITDGDHVLDLGSPTARSLLAYLFLHRDKPTDRRHLAFSFWPRGTESAARRNLRQYLHRLRQTLEAAPLGQELLLADQNGVQVNPDVPIWIDVEQFRQKTQPGARLPDLEEAVNLYTGDLLEDLYEEWCQEERQTFRQIYIKSLERLSSRLGEVGNIDSAIVYANRWVKAEPLDEAAHQNLIRLYSLNGERGRAIQQYQTLADTLERELHVEPLPETNALIHTVQSGSFYPPQKLPVVVENLPLRIHPHEQQIEVPFVGRLKELETLEATYRSAIEGRGGFSLITGESGIGKTRLLEEYLALHENQLCFRTTCHELESKQSFAPIRRLLKETMEQLPARSADQDAPWLAPIASLIPSIEQTIPYLPTLDSEHTERTQLLEALVAFFLDLPRAVNSQPICITIDDLHWGDGLTWDFLARLAHHLPRTSMHLIGLCRIEDMPSERGRLIRTLDRNNLLQQLPLERLTARETAELARHLLPERENDSLFFKRLYQETEGNPFFILEISMAVRNSGRMRNPAVEGPGREIHGGLPVSIQRVIEARLDRLSEPSRELLGTAAAVGRAFTFSFLREVSQSKSEEIICCIEEWEQRDLVREDATGYTFSHDKIRHVVYAGVGRARRQYIHRRIAEVLENVIPRVDASLLAHHYARSDRPESALPYLTKAGEEALQVRSYHEARQFGLQAVSLLGRITGPKKQNERVDISMQLAQAYAFSGDLGRAQEILTEVEPSAIALGEESRLGKLFQRQSQLFWLRGQPDLAGDYARRTLRIAEELGEKQLQQAALRMLGRVSIATSAFDDAIAYLRRYTNGNGQQPADLPIVMGYLGVAYTRVGSWKRAFQVARKGVTMAENSPVSDPSAEQIAAFTRMQLAFVHADQRDWQNCLDVLTPALSQHELTNGKGQESSRDASVATPLGFMLLSLYGLTLAHTGDAASGIDKIRKALAWSERVDYRVFHYLPRFYLAEALLLAEDISAARKECERGISQSRKAGNRWAHGVGLRLLSEILTNRQSPDWTQIESLLIESMQVLRQTRARPDLARTYLAMRKLYDRAGQIAWAVDCHFRAITIFEELGMPDELRQAQGQAATESRRSVVIPNLVLKGPNL